MKRVTQTTAAVLSTELNRELFPTASAPRTLDNAAQDLALRLSAVHGGIKLATEASGLHFYLACPQCLEAEGASELYKRHLAINVDKFLAGNNASVLCMKCGYKCSVVDLEFMPNLEARRFEYKPEAVRFHAPRQDYLEQDEFGRTVPKNPGQVIPVTELPAEHPAIEYLRSRNFRPESLWRQFQCSFCEKENPQLFYRRQPGGFRITPQGRLIFFCLQNRSKVGWQARILEFDEDGKRFFWHPYRNEWVAVMGLDEATQKWRPLPGFEEWDHAKYWTAPGTRRDTVLMGVDAAVDWNAAHGRTVLGQRIGLLMEGPLDAGRLQAPAMAVLGKTLTESQANTLAELFYRIVVIGDNDAAGTVMTESAQKRFATRQVLVTVMELPKRFKDPGSLNEQEAAIFSRLAINKALTL